MFKKSCPILYDTLLNTIGQDFLDIQHLFLNMDPIHPDRNPSSLHIFLRKKDRVTKELQYNLFSRTLKHCSISTRVPIFYFELVLARSAVNCQIVQFLTVHNFMIRPFLRSKTLANLRYYVQMNIFATSFMRSN